MVWSGVCVESLEPSVAELDRLPRLRPFLHRPVPRLALVGILDEGYATED
jgi:hypothetical protein